MAETNEGYVATHLSYKWRYSFDIYSLAHTESLHANKHSHYKSTCMAGASLESILLDQFVGLKNLPPLPDFLTYMLPFSAWCHVHEHNTPKSLGIVN